MIEIGTSVAWAAPLASTTGTLATSWAIGDVFAAVLRWRVARLLTKRQRSAAESAQHARRKRLRGGRR